MKEMSCFSKGEIMSQGTMNYEEIFYGCSMTIKWQNIQENWKHTTQWRKLLVAQPPILCQKLRERLWNLPTVQDRSKPFPSLIFTYPRSSNDSTLCKLFYGLCHRSTYF